VPPRAAYNDQRVFEADIHRLVQGKWDGGSRPVHGQWVDGGAGKETICGRGNELTGHWYGSAYVNWARQALRLVTVSGGTLSLAYPYQIYALRALKQVVVMFFSACGPGLQTRFPELVRFVLNKYDQHVPCGLRVFSYLLHPTESAAYRQSGMTGVMKYDRAKQHVFAEIAFPPFGFLLTGDREPIHLELCDLTHLAEHPFHLKETWWLKLPVLPVVSWFPGDFRTKDELQKSMASSQPVGRVMLDVMPPG
jgi:hypothetical protein